MKVGNQLFLGFNYLPAYSIDTQALASYLLIGGGLYVRENKEKLFVP